MKWIISLVLMSSVYARATAYTVTSSHRTMHVGDLVPPCDVLVKSGSTIVGAGSAIWSAPPTCSVGATSSSPVGTYTITVTAGTLASGLDSAAYTNGSIVVIAPDGIGASLVNAFIPNNGAASPPSGFFSSLPYAVVNLVSNQLCDMSSSDTVGETNWDCLQNQYAALRGARTANVTCSGVTVTASSGAAFTGISAGSITNVGGLWFTVAAITDATHMVLTDTCSLAGTQTVYLPRTMVSVVAGSPNITWVSGPQFTGLTTANQQLQVGTITGTKIATLTDATHIVLNTTIPTPNVPNVTGTVPMYLATLISGGSAGARPLFLYLPCGQYKINHPINSYGAYMSMWGQGQCSELFLPPNSPDFASGQHQFISMNPVNSNDTFHMFLSNLWVHTGVGNPGVIPLQFPPSNYGRIDNILTSSDDAMCPEALNLGKQYTGPGMMSNGAFYGCAIGISSNIPNHAMTGEFMTVEGQTTAGIANVQNHEQFRKVLIDELGIPAATNGSATASLVFMNSEIFDNGGALCMQNSTTALAPSVVYMRDVNVHGSCTTTLNDYGTGTLVPTTGDITEYWTGAAQTLFDSGRPAASLNLPIQETPQANDPAVSTWCAGAADPASWNTSVNGCTATTWYLPPAQYNRGTSAGTATINVPDTINHLQFFGAMPDSGATYHVIINVAGTSATPLIIENCIQSQCAINHTGSRTLVLKDDNTYNYACTTGAGNLFIDDTILGGSLNANGGVTFCPGQSIWMRQSNQEQPTQPKLTFAGNTAWIFGQKTEHNGPNLTLQAGSQVELLGGEALGDPAVQGSGGDVAISTDSSFSMAAFTASTQCTITGAPPCNNQFYFWVDETRLGVDRTLAIPVAQTVGSTQNMGLFYAFGAQTPSSITSAVGGSAVIGGSSAVQ